MSRYPNQFIIDELRAEIVLLKKKIKQLEEQKTVLGYKDGK